MQKERIEWVDVAKGIGILAVVLGHLGVPLLNRLIFPWHMPLFFMLSGMFMSIKNTPQEFCRKKLRALMIPFVATSVALMVAEGFWGLYSSGFGSAGSRMVDTALRALCGSGSLPVFWHVGGIGAIWFLEALCLALITLRILLSCKGKHLLMMALFLAAWLSASVVWLPFNVQSGLFAVPFVYYGYACLRSEGPKSNRSKVLAGLGLIAFAVSFFINRHVMSMVRNYAMPWDLLAAPLIVHFVISLSAIVARWSFVSSILMWYGKNSLTILCCHLFELHEIPWGFCFGRLGLDFGNDCLRLALLIVSKIVFLTVATMIINRFKARRFSCRINANKIVA